MPTKFEFCSPSKPRLSRIIGTRIDSQYGQSTCDVTLSCSPVSPGGTVPPALFVSNRDFESQESASSCDLLLPSLAHPHIHLDKAFLLSHPRYQDYVVKDGDFKEAFEKTTEAKKRYTHDDLVERGRWVISESVNAGVTAMRAFVEVDRTVGFKCLDAAIQLKKEFEDHCYVQICAYAQDPITVGNWDNASLLDQALGRDEVEVVGTTPYVEKLELNMQQNIDWAVATALKRNKSLDFHLDYNLDATKESLVKYLMKRLKEAEWTTRQHPEKRNILLGHCTRLTLFTNQEWKSLAEEIDQAGLKDKITFVGLPTSDTYMQGRPQNPVSDDAVTGARPRATLMAPQLIKDYGLNAVIGINNIGNMYTPQGSCDPLALISSCVGLYQAGTVADTKLLYECISTRAKKAMGLPTTNMNFGILTDTPADFILIPGTAEPERNVEEDEDAEGPRKRRNLSRDMVLGISRRPRLRLFDIVLDPPSPSERRVIYQGSLIQ